MTFENLANIFLSWGRFIKPNQYEDFKKYFEECIKMNRVMFIRNEANEIDAILTFFLTFDENKMYKSSLWSLIEDDPEGDKIIIDIMLCRNWNLPIRRILQDVIEENFNVLEGHYYHAPYGPHVKIKRRRPLNVQRSDLVGSGV